MSLPSLVIDTVPYRLCLIRLVSRRGKYLKGLPLTLLARAARDDGGGRKGSGEGIKPNQRRGVSGPYPARHTAHKSPRGYWDTPTSEQPMRPKARRFRVKVQAKGETVTFVSRASFLWVGGWVGADGEGVLTPRRTRRPGQRPWGRQSVQ